MKKREIFATNMIQSHLLKMVVHDDYVPQVMEEIIEYNPYLKQIVSFVVIMEKA